MAWPGDRVQQMVIAKLSLSLSLNNPSTYDIVQRCSKDICHKNNTERERERERKRASELDAKWDGNCRKQGTTGWISLIGFARFVNVHNSICLIDAKFNGLSCIVPGYRFWGGPYRFAVFRAHLWQKNSNTVVNHFDRDCPCSKQCRLFQTFSVPFNGCSTVESLRVTTSTKRCTLWRQLRLILSERRPSGSAMLKRWICATK